MQSDTCTFCGKQTHNLLEVYTGSKISKRRSFCAHCVEIADACGLCLQSGDKLDGAEMLQSLYRLAHHLLEQIREMRQEQETLRAELDRLDFI